jgi:hypothetical protein
MLTTNIVRNDREVANLPSTVEEFFQVRDETVPLGVLYRSYLVFYKLSVYKVANVVKMNIKLTSSAARNDKLVKKEIYIFYMMIYNVG